MKTTAHKVEEATRALIIAAEHLSEVNWTDQRILQLQKDMEAVIDGLDGNAA